jgi:hypothetical protein
MRWSTKRFYNMRKEVHTPELEWHKKFAWCPVTDENSNWFWLEFIDRRWIGGKLTAWRGYYTYRGRKK